MSEYKAHIRALETEIQELAKRPVLEHGSGLQALRDELANERLALQEARRGTSTNPLSSVPSSHKKPYFISAGGAGRRDGKGQRED